MAQMPTSLILGWFKLVKSGVQLVRSLPDATRHTIHRWALEVASLAAPDQAVALVDDDSDDIKIFYLSVVLLVLFVFFAGVLAGRRSASWNREGDRARLRASADIRWADTPSRTSTPPARIRSQSSPSLLRAPSELAQSCTRQLVFPVPLVSPRAAPKARADASKPLGGN